MQMTSDEELKARLLTAYEQDPDRSKMGRLRKQYDTIIDLQKGGMSLEKILAVLNADMKLEDALTMKTFNGYLYLLRKERSLQWPAVDRRGSAPKKPSKPKGKSKASAAPDSFDLDGVKPGTVNTESETTAPQTAEDRRKDESKKLAEKYSGKLDDENGIGKYL